MLCDGRRDVNESHIKKSYIFSPRPFLLSFDVKYFVFHLDLDSF